MKNFVAPVCISSRVVKHFECSMQRLESSSMFLNWNQLIWSSMINCSGEQKFRGAIQISIVLADNIAFLFQESIGCAICCMEYIHFCLMISYFSINFICNFIMGIFLFTNVEFICELFLFVAKIMLNKTVPLCSWQYERQFNTTRIPGIDTGKSSSILS